MENETFDNKYEKFENYKKQRPEEIFAIYVDGKVEMVTYEKYLELKIAENPDYEKEEKDRCLETQAYFKELEDTSTIQIIFMMMSIIGKTTYENVKYYAKSIFKSFF